MPLKTLLLAATVALAVGGCTRAADQAVDPAFGEKVKAYLLQHPEVIEEAIQKLQEKKDAEAADKAKLALKSDRQTLERDPRDFVANPGGKITVTEFYDYRCPHCINAAPAVLKIIHDNPDVRFVFKEMPIFGATSEHAARTAIAMKNAGGDYLGLYRDFMTTKGLNDAMVDQIAKAHGLDPAKVEQGAARTAADAQLDDAHKLAEKLAVDGTPTFVIGDTIVPGEDMDAVRDAIAKARAKG
jgi:protein-disulfide isomerase